MELALVVYLISILDNVQAFLGSLIFLCCVITFLIFMFEDIECGKIIHKKTVGFLIFTGVFFGMLCAILPSERNAYKIAAAYAAQQVYQSEEAKQIGNKLLKIINQKLDSLSEGKK